MNHLNRRSFIRSTLLYGSGLMLKPLAAWSQDRIAAGSMMGLHPFIHDKPDAVFIMRTELDEKTNSAAMKDVGLSFGRSVFGLTDDPERGVPLTHQMVIKPNLTCRYRGDDRYTIEGSMGIVTDAHFTEGVIESMKELTIAPSQFHLREVNCPDDLEDGGYVDMALRTGVDLKCIDTPYKLLSPDQIVWSEIENGSYFKRLPHIWPVNAPDTWLLNIAKLKSHTMGLTLCAKNLQGTIVKNYQQHCGQWGTDLDVDSGDVYDDAFERIQYNYQQHLSQGIPRWNKPGDRGGIWMETWASRCLDNNAVTKAGLHIIEGIYGRDGHFIDGPNEEGLAMDYMTNYIIFGLNPFYVDIIGHWIGGHEPGNFGLFHMAREKGRISTFNPANIPVFEWKPKSGATSKDLDSFTRYPLKTHYLQKDYVEPQEDRWHLVDEPFDYAAFGDPQTGIALNNIGLGMNYPNPVSHRTHIPFQLKQGAHVRMAIMDIRGAVTDILVDTFMPAGNHMTTWDCDQRPAGLYLIEMQTSGRTLNRKILVIH